MISWPDQVWTEIVGEPFRSQVAEYRAERERVIKEARALADRFGATGVIQAAGQTPTAFSFFKSGPPPNWTKPQGARRLSRPKKYNKSDCALLENAPRMPEEEQYIKSDSIIRVLHYRVDQSSSGMKCIDIPFASNLCWTPERTFLRVPDVKAAAFRVCTERPGSDVLFFKRNSDDLIDVLNWKVPAGLRQVSKAELDLAFAEWKVRKEREAALAEAV